MDHQLYFLPSPPDLISAGCDTTSVHNRTLHPVDIAPNIQNLHHGIAQNINFQNDHHQFVERSQIFLDLKSKFDKCQSSEQNLKQYFDKCKEIWLKEKLALQQEFQHSKSDKEELINKCKNADQQIAGLNNRLNEFKEKERSLCKENLTLQQQLKNREFAWQKNSAKLLKLFRRNNEAKCVKYTDEISTLQQNLKQKEETYCKQVCALQQEIDFFVNEQTLWRETAAEKDQKLKDHGREISTLKKQLKECKVKEATRCKEKSTLQQNLHRDSELIAEAWRKAKSTLVHNVKEFQLKKDAWCKEKSSLQQNFNLLCNNNKTLHPDFVEIKQQFENLSVEKVKLCDEISTLQQSIKEFKVKENEWCNEKSALQETLNQCKANEAALCKEKSSLQYNLDQLSNEKKILNQKFDNLKRRFDNLLAAKTNFCRKDISALQQEISKFNAKEETWCKEKSTLQQEMMQAKQVENWLNDELKKSTEKLAMKQTELLAQISSLERQIVTLHHQQMEEKTTLQQQLENLQQANENFAHELKLHSDNCDKEKANLCNEMSSLHQHLAQCKVNETTLHQENSALKENVTQMTKSLVEIDYHRRQTIKNQICIQALDSRKNQLENENVYLQNALKISNECYNNAEQRLSIFLDQV